MRYVVTQVTSLMVDEIIHEKYTSKSRLFLQYFLYALCHSQNYSEIDRSARVTQDTIVDVYGEKVTTRFARYKSV